MAHSELNVAILEELRVLDARRPGTFAGLCARFVAQYGEFLADPRLRADTLEPAFVRAGAHRLKGSAGALGAVELAECAARLEHAATQGDAASIGLCVQRVSTAFERARELLGAASGVPL